jgi:hypothetical protein
MVKLKLLRDTHLNTVLSKVLILPFVSIIESMGLSYNKLVIGVSVGFAVNKIFVKLEIKVSKDDFVRSSLTITYCGPRG